MPVSAACLATTGGVHSGLWKHVFQDVASTRAVHQQEATEKGDLAYLCVLLFRQ